MTVPAGFVDPLPVADIVAMRATSMPLLGSERIWSSATGTVWGCAFSPSRTADPLIPDRYARCREVVGLVRLWRAEWDAPGKAQPAPALDLFFRKWT